MLVAICKISTRRPHVKSATKSDKKIITINMTKLLLIVLSVAALLTAAAASVAASSINSNSVQPPLHTSGPDIVDSTGARVRLRCANWYGAAEKDFVVGGLDLQPVDKIAGLIKAFGFNCVRLPYSVQMVLQDPPIQANVTTANPQLTGQSALQVRLVVWSACTYCNCLSSSIHLRHRPMMQWWRR